MSYQYANYKNLDDVFSTERTAYLSVYSKKNKNEYLFKIKGAVNKQGEKVDYVYVIDGAWMDSTDRAVATINFEKNEIQKSKFFNEKDLKNYLCIEFVFNNRNDVGELKKVEVKASSLRPNY